MRREVVVAWFAILSRHLGLRKTTELSDSNWARPECERNMTGSHKVGWADPHLRRENACLNRFSRNPYSRRIWGWKGAEGSVDFQPLCDNLPVCHLLDNIYVPVNTTLLPGQHVSTYVCHLQVLYGKLSLREIVLRLQEYVWILTIVINATGKAAP
jgi:hypothetical protein